MRKLILTATGLLCLAGGSYCFSTAWGAPKEVAEEAPHRVGLIDTQYVFEHYEKFKHMGEEWKSEVLEDEAKLKAKAKKLQELQEELKEFTDGSPEFSTREAKLSKLAAEFDGERKFAQVKAKREQAKVHHQIYLEIQDAVEKFCNHHKFTVIIQFRRTDPSSNDPNKVAQLMQQVVVYHRKRDDLTDGVLKYLNERYLSTAGGDAKPISQDQPAKKSSKSQKIQQAGGTKD